MLLKNQILKHVESNQLVRILDMDFYHDVVWLFNLTHPKALPKQFSLAETEAAVDDGIFIEFESDTVMGPRKYSDAAVRRRDKSYSAIELLIQSREIFDPTSRSKKIRARAKELNCSEQTLYTYLRAWWRGGQSKQGLIPEFHKIGSDSGDTQGRGRPPSIQKYSIYQVGDQDRKWMKSIIEKHYLKDKIFTVQHAYQCLLEEHYSYYDGDGRRCIKSQGECPSITQFRCFLNKAVSKEDQIRARHGNAEFDLNHRSRTGSLRASSYTVGQFFEIDATIVDQLLVHEEDRSKIIGKPTLYTIRDRKSNLVVGIYIGLENPSWMAAMQAIKFISEDKVAICRKYGVKYDPEDWPAHRCFPNEFIGDRGSEVMSDTSNQIAENLEISIRNLPANRADWKPHVECGFKQIQRSLANIAPGYTPPEDFGKRQVRNRTKDAALTLKEFTRLILSKVIEQNKSPLTNNPMDAKHILNGTQPTPINIWNTEIRERAGLLTHYTENQVFFALLPQAEASISREGIIFDGRYYNAPEALNAGWFFEAGNGRFKKEISHDLRSVDSIFVHDKNQPNGYFVAKLQERSRQYAGLSFAEAKAMRYQTKLIQSEGKQMKLQNESDFNALIKPMVDNAVAETKAATKGKSRSARKKDTVAARTDARRAERQEATQIAETVPSPAPKNSVGTLLPGSVATGHKPKSKQSLYQELLDGN